MTPWFPNLSGLVHPEVERAILNLYKEINPSPSLESTAAVPVHQIAQRELQVNGSAPLNVGGLLGLLSQPQKALAPISPAPGAPSSSGPAPQPGQFQIQNGVLYFFNNGTWQQVTASAGPTTVTPGTYGDSGHVGQFTVQADGRLTFAGSIPISSLVGLPVFATNAAAITGGLAIGGLYRTGADPDFVAVVH